MDKNLDYYLVKKYASIFRERYESMTKTNMCWGFECDDGWFKIIDNFCSLATRHIESQKITYNQYKAEQALIDANRIDELPKWSKEWYETQGFLKEEPEPCDLVIHQVKEKFGMLRIYYSGGDEYIRALTNFAELLSGQTCEECGKEGRLRQGGWIRTLCDEHAQKNNYEDTDSLEVGSVISVLTHEGEKPCEVKEVISSEQVKVSIYKYHNQLSEKKEKQEEFHAFLVKTPMSEFWDSQK